MFKGYVIAAAVILTALPLSIVTFAQTHRARSHRESRDTSCASAG